MDVQLYLQMDGGVTIHDPAYGNIKLLNSSRWSIGLTDSSVFVKLLSEIRVTEKTIKVLCFNLGAGHICHDPSFQQFFPFDAGAHVCSGNTCYYDHK